MLYCYYYTTHIIQERENKDIVCELLLSEGINKGSLEL